MNTERDDLRERHMMLPSFRDLYSGMAQQAVITARIDAKLDAALALQAEVGALQEDLAEQNVRIVKLESFQGTILWITNGGWGALAGIAFILAKLGVL